MNKQTILEGSSNQHNLVGDFKIINNKSDNLTTKLIVIEAKLIHEKDNKYAEHGTLNIPKGEYEITNQVEFNPLTNNTSFIWD